MRTMCRQRHAALVAALAELQRLTEVEERWLAIRWETRGELAALPATEEDGAAGLQAELFAIERMCSRTRRERAQALRRAQEQAAADLDARANRLLRVADRRARRRAASDARVARLQQMAPRCLAWASVLESRAAGAAYADVGLAI